MIEFLMFAACMMMVIGTIGSLAGCFASNTLLVYAGSLGSILGCALYGVSMYLLST